MQALLTGKSQLQMARIAQVKAVRCSAEVLQFCISPAGRGVVLLGLSFAPTLSSATGTQPHSISLSGRVVSVT